MIAGCHWRFAASASDSSPRDKHQTDSCGHGTATGVPWPHKPLVRTLAILTTVVWSMAIGGYDCHLFDSPVRDFLIQMSDFGNGCVVVGHW